MQLANSIKAIVRDVHDFPKPGIVFKDITPVLAEPVIRKEIIHAIVNNFKAHNLDAVAGIEARGFILGSLIAQELNLPFIPIRKSGKLPYKSLREEYALEYGTAAIEIHEDAVGPGDRVLIHDDLLATGGTALAAGQLVKKSGAIVAGFSFLINLTFLPGESRLRNSFDLKPFSVVHY
ncbi:MAG TPA: adenine phosphoribosyltransferase [Cyclobacteriaceae bacterium]|nr:adenine phosphoribosyltransferase [Cyclobacteriaceae bacterium]